MCRSIKTLRPPYTPDVSVAEVEAASLQYVRKVAGMRAPSARNQAAFDAAVAAVTAATQTLLRDLTVRPTPAAAAGPAVSRPPAPARARPPRTPRATGTPSGR
jgi:hypothetical protein